MVTQVAAQDGAAANVHYASRAADYVASGLASASELATMDGKKAFHLGAGDPENCCPESDATTLAVFSSMLVAGLVFQLPPSRLQRRKPIPSRRIGNLWI